MTNTVFPTFQTQFLFDFSSASRISESLGFAKHWDVAWIKSAHDPVWTTLENDNNYNFGAISNVRFLSFFRESSLWSSLCLSEQFDTFSYLYMTKQKNIYNTCCRSVATAPHSITLKFGKWAIILADTVFVGVECIWVYPND
jgi:hypothetical protein